jgi:pilus assembly protein CpaE
MLAEFLNISILHVAPQEGSDLAGLVAGMPRVKLLSQGNGPEEIIGQGLKISPDLVLVNLDGQEKLPPWLEDLCLRLPRSSVMLCSSRTEPEFLIRAMQMGVREFLPLPVTRDTMEAALQRVRQARLRLVDPTTTRGRIIVVTGHKGGVGATSVAINLAIALGEVRDESVALVDLGRPFPDVGHFLDQEANYSIFDLIQNIKELDHAFLKKIIQPYEGNLFIVHGIADFKEQDSIDLEALEKIFTLLRSLYKWVVVDLSHWLDDLFLKVLSEADLVLLLTAMTVPDLRNLGSLWPLLREWQLVQDRIKLVVNRYEKSNGLSLKNLDQVVKEPVFATLPNDGEPLLEAINRGVPLAKTAPSCKLYLALQELAQRLQRHMGLQEEVSSNGARAKRRFWIF